MDEENEDWDLHDGGLSWQIWCLMETVGWQHLPMDGGLLDQPDWLWEDLQTIAWRKECIEKMMGTGGASGNSNLSPNR